MPIFTLKTTQARVALLVGVLALTAAVTTIIGMVNAAAVQQDLVEIEQYASLLDQHAQTRASLLKQQIAVKDVTLTQAGRAYDFGMVYQTQSQIDEYLYQQEMEYWEEPVLEGLADSNDLLNEQIDQFLVKMNEENIDPEAMTEDVLDRIDPAAEEMEAWVLELADYDRLALREQVAAIQQRARVNLLVGQAALLVLAGLIIWGVYSTQRIAAPIEHLTGAIVAFENNTYTPDLLAGDVQRPDELGGLARAVGGMAQSISESNRLKEQFLKAAQRFIPEQYLEFLEKESITQVQLGDHVSAEMAVMFSDIRGFTSLSEKMSAQENFDFVNEYLKLVSPIIQKHEGFIVKFLGDGMMAIFPYGVDDAVRAGIDKARMVQRFNEQLKERGLPPITVGIGIHTGPMMVGMIGEEMRMQGDAFSDNVNLTSRIEGLNKFFGTSMIISEDTLRQLPQPVTFQMRYLGKALVKGRTTPLAMYEIYEGLQPAEVALKEATRPAFEQALELYVQGSFMEAGQVFNQVLEKNPGDHTARYYLERCADLLGQPIPAGWDGTIIMDAK